MAKICSSNHEGGHLPAAFNNLPESQAGIARHKCAGCAYELGRAEGAAAEGRLRDRLRALTEEIALLKKGAT